MKRFIPFILALLCTDALATCPKSVETCKKTLKPSAPVAQKLVKVCDTTPLAFDSRPATFFYQSNDLRRKNGSTIIADGKPITISGVILDKNCVPVTDAVVDIWQPDPHGKRIFDQIQKPDEERFDGTGRTITNNLGEYVFYTVYPGVGPKGQAPRIYFKIRHKDFETTETVMFFKDHPNNDNSKILKKAINESKQYLLFANEENDDRNTLDDGVHYSFNITLEGVNLYKKL